MAIIETAKENDMRRSKIVATLGPASNSSRQIERLITAGVNIFRLNFSHGAPAEHRTVVSRVRKAARKKEVMP